ncbi:MAG TPA: PVC-type heme-binding CxxCH protein [Lacipirellulaceae bacterium]|nr:PVC-type heme-binding CxxCH protein [Lacipirellulaceae bacterium]
MPTTGDVHSAAPIADALPPGTLPLRLQLHERIALVGGSLAERMSLFGNFETLLDTRFPRLELLVRNFGWPADAVDNSQRPNNYTTIDDPLKVFSPDTYLCFFGFNESFAGPSGEQRFRVAYGKYLDEMAKRYPRTNGKPPRFVLISPTAWEATNNALWPDANKRNETLRRYAAIVAHVARERGLAYVDLFTPTLPVFNQKLGMQYTIDGCHLNEAGDREVAVMLDRALFGETTAANMDSDAFQKLRAAVNDKSWIHFQDYRMLNGWYVYGGRRTWDTQTFPLEYKKVRAMAAVRDRYVWDLAQGKSAAPPDDSQTGKLIVPPTRFGNPQQHYSEPAELKYLSPEECIRTMKVPDGFEVKLFASEREFPELAKPDQINFDDRGRLWVSCMPTYPQWKPGDPRPNDRLLILEDTDHDGRADKCKVFYDKLHCPTGFEFWNGGVLVISQPYLLWLKDTNGDDKADVVVHLIDGWASDDTHQSVSAFQYSPGGALMMLEGIAMSTTVETPWGPLRRKDAPGAYALDPRTLKINHYVTPGYGNPWCYVYDSWGQGFVGDGTTAQQHWDSPLSGAEVSGRRGIDPIFNNQGMRPCVGNELLFSRQFPDDVQGQFIYACVINMNGIPRFEVHDSGAGYAGHRLMKSVPDGKGGMKEVPDDLLVSTDKNFRPVDPQIGPDGALWFGDWCNALIGHMQYSQRDPNRDHTHGRIYRMVYKNKKLLQPVTQYGKTESQLLDQLRAYELRTRYRARRELRDRPTPVVVAAVKKWVAELDRHDPEYDRLRCEALWALQSHHADDENLLKEVLHAKSPNARAAAIRVAADERDYLPNSFQILAAGVHDENPRARLEAIRGLSFFPTLASAKAALAVLDRPTDSWIDYTLEHTLAALEPAWKGEYQNGSLIAGNSRANKFIQGYIARRAPTLAAQAYVKNLVNPDASPVMRAHAYESLEKMHGNTGNGIHIFGRICATCHRIGNVGYTFGPELTDVGKRLSRRDILESIVEPSKKVDPKYVTTTIITNEGKSDVGFITAKTKESITLLMAGGKTVTIRRDDIDEMAESKLSSMPDNLASTLAPSELLDIVEYLCTRK